MSTRPDAELTPFHTTLRVELGAAIERTLVDEARRNELRLGWVRLVALAFATALDSWFYLDPRSTIGADWFSPVAVLVAGGWLVSAAVFSVALHRGWYRHWIPYSMPVADGAMILSLFLITYFQSQHYATPGAAKLVTVTASVCTLLAVTGALRLKASAAASTALAATAVFAVVSVVVGYRFAEAAFVCAMILSAGALGVWIAQLVRRAVESEARSVILRRLLPADLVDAGHDAAFAMVTEPRACEASVLVSDIRGFTRYADGRPPAEVLAFLNRVQGAFADIVRQQGGVVDKFLGDGMLAVFGAFQSQSDHAVRALHAAAAMLRAADGFDVRIGVGVHTGMVIVGTLGSGERLELTVIGDTVNAASRLEGIAKEQGVRLVVSADSIRSAGNSAMEFALRPAGEIVLRGRQQSLGIFVGD